MGRKYRDDPPRPGEGKEDPTEIASVVDFQSYQDRRNGIAPEGCCYWCHSELIPMYCETFDLNGIRIATTKTNILICPRCTDEDFE